MPSKIFPGRTIAVIWDFDKTLLPGYMQEPLFDHYGVDADRFWEEVQQLPDHYARQGIDKISEDSIYLNHLLSYARSGLFEGLDNELLRDLGDELAFYDGIPQVFQRLRDHVRDTPEYAKHDVEVEHYIISTGLRQMILGSEVADHVEDVWACEFIEDPMPPKQNGDGFEQASGRISQIGYVIDNTTKTRAIFEINKGTNKHPTDVDVNAKIPHEERRIPFENMIYVADGPSDIPVFSVVNGYEGRTYAVYNPEQQDEFEQVKRLLEQDRIDAFGPADYREGTQTHRWLVASVREIADRIVADIKQDLTREVGSPPRHLTGDED